MKKINVKKMLGNMKSEFKAGYSESKARYDAKFEAAVVKAEEAGYKAVKAVYAPAYGVGYVTDAIATTVVAKHISNAVENVKFSATEGYTAGKEAHHLNTIAKKNQEVQVQVTSNLAQSIDEYTESAAIKRAAKELAARWQREFEEYCDEEEAVYYEGNDTICGDGVWTGDTAF
jgi:hypothetical protein